MRSRTVAIIGSFRHHYAEVLSAWSSFRAAGWVVTSPVGTPIIEEGIPFVRFESDDPAWDDPTVQTVALHRILRAELVYVVAPAGYIGRTTCYELGRVLQVGRPVYFSARPVDLPVSIPELSIASPDDVVRRHSSDRAASIFDGVSGEHAEWERRLCTGDYLDL